MIHKKTLSPTSAIIVALTTMIGGGLFVNPRQLGLMLGAYSPFAYVVAALLMLPLIITIAELTRLQPVSSGLYVYSRQYLGSFAGFLSGWTYFLAKSTSPAFLIHTVNTYFYHHFEVLQDFHPLALDAGLIGFLTLLHIIGISVTSRIQYLFVVMKVTPLLFGLMAGFWMFYAGYFDFDVNIPTLESARSAIPVCLYALIGFEVICSIGGFVENPERNIRRTILIAFAVVSCATVLLQISLFGSLGPSLAHAQFPMLNLGFLVFGQDAFPARLVNGLVFASISGGAFFMFGSNCWNLYALGKNNHLPFGTLLTRVNRHGAPWVALLLQACTAFTMVSITTSQLPLQNMVIFSIFSCFLMSSLAALRAGMLGLLHVSKLIPVLAIGTCCYVLSLCLSNIVEYGISVSFLSFFVAGLAAALFQAARLK